VEIFNYGAALKFAHMTNLFKDLLTTHQDDSYWKANLINVFLSVINRNIKINIKIRLRSMKAVWFM